MGPETEDDKAIRILNRLVQWTSGGIEYEADQRHAELIVADAGLNMASGQRAPPGVKANLDEASEPLNAEETTRYRSSVARAIYLSQDRPDILYAVKELIRNQCNPTERHTGRQKAGKILDRMSKTSTEVRVPGVQQPSAGMGGHRLCGV